MSSSGVYTTAPLFIQTTANLDTPIVLVTCQHCGERGDIRESLFVGVIDHIPTTTQAVSYHWEHWCKDCMEVEHIIQRLDGNI